MKAYPQSAFNDNWFYRNQSVLLKLLNSRVSKNVVRRLLHITDYDVPIIEIISNRVIFFDSFEKDGSLNCFMECRSRPVYSYAVYLNFKALWWFLHGWDYAIADRFMPQLSYGFNLLTVKPDSGLPGTTTTDAIALRSGVNETFSTIRGGAGNNVSNSSDTGPELFSSSTSNQYSGLSRLIATFNSALSGGCTGSVSAAKFSMISGALGGKNNWNGSPDLHAAGATPASNNNIVNSDYGQCQTTSFGSITYANFTNSVWNDLVLNSSGLSNITLSGISKFSFQLSWDINNSFTGAWQASGSSTFNFRSGDDIGLGLRLIIYYNEVGRVTPCFNGLIGSISANNC